MVRQKQRRGFLIFTQKIGANSGKPSKTSVYGQNRKRRKPGAAPAREEKAPNAEAFGNIPAATAPGSDTDAALLPYASLPSATATK